MYNCEANKLVFSLGDTADQLYMNFNFAGLTQSWKSQERLIQYFMVRKTGENAKMPENK